MSRRYMTWLLAVTIVGVMAGVANAWNDTGHRVVALIAYEALDDATKKKVQDILSARPGTCSVWL